MRLICPSCGAAASLEAWANDPDARDALIELIKLSERIQPPSAIAAYLGMFRPKGGALPWRVVCRLLRGLSALLVNQENPVIWSQGIATLETRRSSGTLELPLTNHGYLIKVVRDLAERAPSSPLTQDPLPPALRPPTETTPPPSPYRPSPGEQHTMGATIQQAIQRLGSAPKP